MDEAPSPSRSDASAVRSSSERLDNFVDGAFAFAITLLVISGASLPRTVPALIDALRGIPAFAVCFLQLALFWHGHVRWRETFRLTDGRGMRLSLLLVFFALIFVFPLHLVYASFFNSISNGVLSPDFVRTPGNGAVRSMAALFACYGLSYACMGGTLSALFLHGARHGPELTRAKALSARMNAMLWAYFAVIGLLSMSIALVAGASGLGWLIAAAGFSYILLAFTGVVLERYRRRVDARLPS
jgi:uncharacterized membrane protein